MQNLYMAISQNAALTVSYRWLAWLLAAGAMVVSPPATGLNAALAIFLLALLLLVRSLSLSTWRTRYATTLAHRPWLLLLDGLLGLLCVHLSGGGLLPFYAYALAALILPALVFGWRATLLATALFITGDLLLLLAINDVAGWTALALVPRLLLPVLFTVAWLLLGYWQQHRLRGHRLPTPPGSTPKANTARRSGISSGIGPPAATVVVPRPWYISSPPPRADTPTPATPPHGEQPCPNSALALPHEASNLRRVMHASIAAEADLSTALQSLVENFNRHTSVALRLQHEGDVCPLLPFQRRTLLRLAEEALINIDQHASAHSAVLMLTFANNTVSLAIADDGVGLLDGTYMRPGVHALRAMEYCFAELDGSLQVLENEHGGVVVCGSLPLHPS